MPCQLQRTLCGTLVGRDTHREQVIIADRPHVSETERQEGLRAARGGHELDLDDLVRVEMHDSAKIAGTETGIRHIVREDDGIKFAKSVHRSSDGYAVTKRGTSSPDRTIQTVATGALRPVGPRNIPRTR